MKDSTILGVTKSPNIAAIGTRADFADLACIRWTKSQIIILERYNDKVSRSPDAGQGFGNVDCGLRIAALLSSPVGSIIKGCPLTSILNKAPSDTLLTDKRGLSAHRKFLREENQ